MDITFYVNATIYFFKIQIEFPTLYSYIEAYNKKEIQCDHGFNLKEVRVIPCEYNIKGSCFDAGKE